MNENYCVCCGASIPEGRMICWDCEHSSDNSNYTEVVGYKRKDKTNEKN